MRLSHCGFLNLKMYPVCIDAHAKRLPCFGISGYKRGLMLQPMKSFGFIAAMTMADQVTAHIVNSGSTA
ncbi:hypothetical protein EMIT0P43_40472 [Pseudomonas jessenii]